MSILVSLKKIWQETKLCMMYATHDRKPFYNIACRYLAKCSKILDIGTGDGRFLEVLNRHDIYVMDGNLATATHLKKTQMCISVCSILPNMPFADYSFEGVHVSHVLEHLYPKDFYSTLREINRVLKPGGILVVSSPVMWENFYSDLSHIKPYNPQVFKYYLCGSALRSRTRLQIGGYTMIELTYRYRFEELRPLISRQCNLFNFFSILLTKLLKKLSIGHFQRSGYTIVFKKN